MPTVNRFTRSDDLPELLKVPEVCRVLRRSKNSVYAAIKDGSIPHVRVGKHGILVPRSFFQTAQQISPSTEQVKGEL